MKGIGNSLDRLRKNLIHQFLTFIYIETFLLGDNIACALGSVKKYTSLSDDLYHFFGIVLCYQQPKYAFKK